MAPNHIEMQTAGQKNYRNDPKCTIPGLLGIRVNPKLDRLVLYKCMYVCVCVCVCARARGTVRILFAQDRERKELLSVRENYRWNSLLHACACRFQGTITFLAECLIMRPVLQVRAFSRNWCSKITLQMLHIPRGVHTQGCTTTA